MLILSRRLNEKVVFPSLGLTVQVVALKPGVVRLGIEAPPEVQVLRAELLGWVAAGAPTSPDPFPTGNEAGKRKLSP
jgi:carbon storage regulator CsrA